MDNYKAAADMHLFLLDDTGILFSESRQEIHSLNTSATAIWCLMEEGKETPQMVSEFAGIFDLSRQQAEDFVTSTMQDWRSKGFLDGSGFAIDIPEPSDSSELNAAGLPEWSHCPFVAERFYCLQDSCLHFRFSAVEQAAVVHPVLAHLQAEPDAARPQTLIDIIVVEQKIVLYRDRKPLASCCEIDELAPLAQAYVVTTALRDHPFLLDIHAGVVGDDGGCILLIAPPGGGKSTLTAALVNAGFQYFSDEVALLEEGSFNVFPFPLALCFKDTGIAAASEFFPEISALPMHNRIDGKRVCYLSPPAHMLPQGKHARRVKAVVFVGYQVNATGIFEPMDNLETLQRMLDECIVIDRHLDKSRVANLVDWIRQVNSYRLVYASTEEAISRIEWLK